MVFARLYCADAKELDHVSFLVVNLTETAAFREFSGQRDRFDPPFNAVHFRNMLAKEVEMLLQKPELT